MHEFNTVLQTRAPQPSTHKQRSIDAHHPPQGLVCHPRARGGAVSKTASRRITHVSAAGTREQPRSSPSE
eukprot:5061231-Prymnesium_polylepis.1